MYDYIIKGYLFEEEYQKDFINLMKKLYSGYKNSDLYVRYIKKLLDKNNPSFRFIKIKNFIAYKYNEVIGHVSSIIDSRLNKDDISIGLIGFYECIEDDKISSLLINKAIKYLKDKNCKVIRVPIDLTIWYNYRFVIDQKETDSFMLEPLTKNYYINQFEREGFKSCNEYASAKREDFNTILSYTKKDYEEIIKEGFVIRNLTKKNFKKDILSIYKLVNEIFQDSWSFVKISKEEYLYIYKDYKDIIDKLLIQIIMDKEGKDIGFCSSIIDSLNKNTIILKTIGILPEYQNKKIGAALLYSKHKKAQEIGILNAIYALIKIDNNVTKLPYPGVKVIRKYITLEKQII